MKKSLPPPYLRGWYQAQRAEMEESRTKSRNKTMIVMAIILVFIAALIVIDSHKSASASYSAIPSADVVLMASHQKHTTHDEDRRLTRLVEREWKRIEGRK